MTTEGPISLSVREEAEAVSGELRVSVVVCSYAMERRPLLEACIASLRAQDAPLYEIVIVIDNNEALRVWAEGTWPELVVVANDAERGLSGARNTGVERASGDLVAFLDDDARARPDWLSTILRAWTDEGTVHAVGGTVAPDWESGRPPWFPAEFDWVVGCTYRGLPEGRQPVRNIIGASMAFRRTVLLDVGGFRPELGRVGTRPLGCEETELCIRVGRVIPKGAILFDPEMRVDHVVPRARATLPYFVARCYSEGISKAVVSRLVGPGDGLQSERRYVAAVLPAGVARGVRDGLAGPSRAGFLRAGAIVLGLVSTVAGYARGHVMRGLPDSS